MCFNEHMSKSTWLLIIRYPKYRAYYRFATENGAIQHAESLKAQFSDLTYTVEQNESDRIYQ